MPSWKNTGRWGKSVDERQREREQRYRDQRAEASREYLADIAGESYDPGYNEGDRED